MNKKPDIVKQKEQRARIDDYRKQGKKLEFATEKEFQEHSQNNQDYQNFWNELARKSGQLKSWGGIAPKPGTKPWRINITNTHVVLEFMELDGDIKLTHKQFQKQIKAFKFGKFQQEELIKKGFELPSESCL